MKAKNPILTQGIDLKNVTVDPKSETGKSKIYSINNKLYFMDETGAKKELTAESTGGGGGEGGNTVVSLELSSREW